jgi:hypothetical protein
MLTISRCQTGRLAIFLRQRAAGHRAPNLPLVKIPLHNQISYQSYHKSRPRILSIYTPFIQQLQTLVAKMPLPESLKTPEFTLLNTPSRATTSITNQLTRAVNEAAAANASSDDIEGLLWRLWNAIIATASRTPPQEQGQLSYLLQDIAAQRQLENGEGEEVEVWGKKVWSDLPIFGAAVREVFNSGESSRSIYLDTLHLLTVPR